MKSAVRQTSRSSGSLVQWYWSWPPETWSQTGTQEVVGRAELPVGDVHVVAVLVGARWVPGLAVAGAGDGAVGFAHVAEAHGSASSGPALTEAVDPAARVANQLHDVAADERAVLVVRGLAVERVVVVAGARARVEDD